MNGRLRTDARMWGSRGELMIDEVGWDEDVPFEVQS